MELCCAYCYWVLGDLRFLIALTKEEDSLQKVKQVVQAGIAPEVLARLSFHTVKVRADIEIVDRYRSQR